MVGGGVVEVVADVRSVVVDLAGVPASSVDVVVDLAVDGASAASPDAAGVGGCWVTAFTARRSWGTKAARLCPGSSLRPPAATR